MMKLLTVFNTCGVSGADNSAQYIENTRSILEQDFLPNMDVVISDCCTPQHIRDKVVSEFGNKIHYNFIDTLVPVNVSFNHTCRVMTDKYGAYDGYLYIDSGIKLTDKEAINKLASRLNDPCNALISARTNTDNGTFLWFGLGSGCGDESAQDQLFKNGDLVIPVGKALNLHVQIFTRDVYEAYNHKLMPDIFASYCTESTFSFVAAGLGKRWVMAHDVMCEHKHGMDGGSSGFKPEGLPYPAWQHIFGTKRTIFDVIHNGDAIECGFGYEECQNILPHNSAVYDENGNHENPELLRKFIAENIYLQDDEFDYNSIQYQLV